MVAKFFTLLYYILGAHLPDTHMPGGGVSSNIRVFFLRRFLSKCGHHVKIGSHVLVGNGGDVSLGDHVQINDHARIRNATIGNYVMIAPEVMILNLGHTTTSTDIPMMQQEKRAYPQTLIDDDVWIGARAIIMPGVHLSEGSVVAAGAVVSKNTEPYSVVGGVPARLLKYRKTPKAELL